VKDMGKEMIRSHEIDVMDMVVLNHIRDLCAQLF